MRELSIRDLEIVSGAVGPAGAAVGAIIGGVSYLSASSVTGEASLAGFAAAVVVGGGTGFFTGGAASLIASAPRIGFYGGLAGAGTQNMLGESNGDAAGTNYSN